MHNPVNSLQSVPWSHTSWTFPVAVFLLISCIIGSPVCAAVITNETAVPVIQEKSLEFLKGGYRHPLMHFTPDQLSEIQLHYETAPRYNASSRLRGHDGDIPAGSKDLLTYLEYTPSERDQGWCGNCWVWASTGALEIENNVRSGIRDRLSVQYFNSRYNGGAGSGWACCGGWLGQFTSFYSGDTTAVPWSNAHAGYGDYYSYCEKYATAVPASSITTEPSYTINSISDSSVETAGTGQSAAISNIKSALNDNRPVWYAFYYGNNGWNAFENFWMSESENAVFDPNPYAGEENSGGHAVLIVGYDDTDPANPYWIVLNSWGTTGNRPQGLFRVNMSMDYDSLVYSSGNPFRQHMFSVLEADVVPAPATVVNFTADTTSGAAPLLVQFTDQSDVVDPLEWDWNFGDGSYSSTRDPQHEYTTGGTYTVSLNITNSSGEYSRTRKNYIAVRVIVPKPFPEFSASPLSGQVPLTVSFTDASRTDPAGWAWFFGDEDYAGQWTAVNAGSAWTERYGQTSVVMPDGSIILMGGFDGTIRMNDVWRSTDNGTTWTEMTPHAAWPARYFHTSVALADGSIIVMGGSDGNASYKNDVWRSADSGVTWTEQTAYAEWPGRTVHSSVALPDDSIVLMGGNDGYGGGRLNDVWRSTDYGATWTRLTAGAEWDPRWAQSTTVLPDGTIVLTGGWSGIYLSDVWQSTDKGATWMQVNSSMGGSLRGYHSSVTLPDDSILIMGGINESGGRNDVWRSADRGATWTLLTDDAGWSDRYYQNGVSLPDGSVTLIGGRNADGGLNDVWQFNPAGSVEQNPVHTYTSPGTYSVALQVTNASGTNSTQKSGYITVTGRYGTTSSVGVFRPSNQLFILKNATERTLVNWGISTDTPVTGDWNADGLSDVGVFRPSNQLFILKNGTEKTVVKWGLSTDTPVSGDWDADGRSDVGVFRPSIRSFILKNGTDTTIVNWGLSTDIPVSGDWNADGFSDVGVFRPSTHRFILSNGTEKTVVKWGLSTDIPVSGDWNGDGLSDVGVFRPSSQKFILSNGTERTVVPWGMNTDIPVTGAWI